MAAAIVGRAPDVLDCVDADEIIALVNSRVERMLPDSSRHSGTVGAIVEEQAAGPRLLVVDDEDIARIPLIRVLSTHGYVCDEATNTAEALDCLRTNDSYLAALCDIEMPGESGLELARRIAADHQNVAVIMTTGIDDVATADTAFEIGAYGYLLKPISMNQLLITLTGALRRGALEQIKEERNWSVGFEATRSRALASVLTKIEDNKTDDLDSLKMIEILARAVSLRDDETGQHMERMSRHSANLAMRVGFSDLSWDQFRMAAALHDVGKIGVPDSVLSKPARLTSDEWMVMQRHPLMGFQLLQRGSSELLKAAASMALSHHERWDGNGYPHGLRGVEIPREARIAAIGDVFDALTSRRNYKVAMEVDKALDFMTEQRGTHFEPELLDAFLDSRESILEVREEFPDTEPHPRIRVLIIDDHEVFVESLSRLLATRDEVRLVGSAGTAAEGIEATISNLPDVVLMDFELPDEDGARATQTIVTLDPRIKVVMLTARSDRDALTRAVAAGACGFVHKAESVEELISAIIAAHKGEIPNRFAEVRDGLRGISPTQRGLGLDLTPREIEILQLMALGHTNSDVANSLYISAHTSRNHTHNIFQKLGVHSKLEAVATAMREGILTSNVYHSDLSA
jgi:cyclic di-GMP phosphodiesterase